MRRLIIVAVLILFTIYSPLANDLNFYPLKWTAKASCIKEINAHKNELYGFCHSKVPVFDTESGELLEEVDLLEKYKVSKNNKKRIFIEPNVHQGKIAKNILIGNNNLSVYGMDLATKEILWQKNNLMLDTSPLIYEDKVYLNLSLKNKILEVDSKMGKITNIFSFKRDSSEKNKNDRAPVRPFGISGKYLIGRLWGVDKTFCFCLDLESEDIVWKLPVEEGLWDSIPLVEEKYVYLLKDDEVLQKIEIKSGKVVEEHKKMPETLIYRMSGDNQGRIYFLKSGRIISFDTSEMKRQWITEKIYQKKKYNACGAVYNGKLYIGTTHGDLLEINPETGKILKKYVNQKKDFIRLLAKDGFLYAFTNEILCFDLER